MFAFRLIVSLLVVAVGGLGFANGPVAKGCELVPYHSCGAGEMLCRCRANVFADLTRVAVGPGSREYVDARLLEMGNKLAHDWRPGDILFVGDSLTDLGRLDFDPLLPRSHNLGILGAKIQDVQYTLDLFEMFFASPSKVVVLIGTNNLRPDAHSFPAFREEEFNALMSRLARFKAQHQCEIIVRSIPPGEPDPTPPISPKAYHLAFNDAVRRANAYLSNASTGHGFTFVNEYVYFWNETEGRIDRTMFVGGRYMPCVPADYLHLGCLGYMVSNLTLAESVYQKLSPFGQVSQLLPSPEGPPVSRRDMRTQGNVYRYAAVTVPPGHLFSLSVFGSGYNYVSYTDPIAVFASPDFPHGYPSMESEASNGAAASIVFRNTMAIPHTIIVCLGSSAAQPAMWSVNMLQVVD